MRKLKRPKQRGPKRREFNPDEYPDGADFPLMDEEADLEEFLWTIGPIDND